MKDFQPQIIAFCCSNCASAAANVADGMNMSLPDNIKIIQVPCTGRIEVLHLIKPFEDGADGVYIAGCQEDSCQFISGILRASKRVAQAKGILEALNIESDRLALFNLSAGRGRRFVDVAYEMIDRVKELGPVQASAGFKTCANEG